ncbi:hypothetical protein [Thiocystis minor]|uniref:hypothetical protein n=1 Tax=Thiocystis minor TaxID=61597 RepID=UPI0019137385|nr:hypothetical protein [Thiocystis minor]
MRKEARFPMRFIQATLAKSQNIIPSRLSSAKSGDILKPVRQILTSGWRGKGLAVMTVEINDLIDDLAEILKHGYLVVTMTSAEHEPRTTAHVATIFV